MRIGLIGLGRIGAFHAHTLKGMEQVDELLVTDVVDGLAAAVADELGATAVDTPEALLTAGLDGVVIASSTGTHPDLIVRAVQAGITTFCEKPVALAARDAQDVQRRIAGHDVPVQIGFPRRFDAAFVAAREDLVQGRLGRLHTVRSTTLDPAPPPEAYIQGSGGIFRDCSIHDFDAIRWATGREVVEVYAAGGNRGADYIAAAGDADTASAILTLDDGTLAVVSNTRENGRGHDVRLELLGSQDSVAAGLDDGLPLRSATPGAIFPAGPPAYFFMDRFAGAFRAELAAFVDVVAGTRPSPCTVADGVEASLIAEACTVSRREHRPVTIDEVR
ncbi:MAG: Gfo/Idh/MocA family oxidoreductase [Nocardioidaceae bacterium]|nr:Gfo/Idh/MocA family oxidoreductase [Nocardioidaceae bacterium]